MTDLQTTSLKEDKLPIALSDAAARGLQLRVGWVGRSADPKALRIYLSPAFERHLEVAQADVAHIERVDPQVSPLGGSLVWLRRGAVVRESATRRADAQADFLSGGITAARLPSSVGPTGLPLGTPEGPLYATWTIAITVTFFALALGLQVSAILDCIPGNDGSDSAGPQCATNVSHCC